MKEERNCTTCANLDKSRKRAACGAYQYGCTSRKNDGFMPVWINNDRLLADCSCTKGWMPKLTNARQLTIQEFLGGM